MNKSLLKLAGVLLLALSVSSIAKADPINGDISFTGQFTLNSPIASATQVTSFANTQVGTTSGDFASIALGTAATFASSWTFNAGGPQASLWAVSGFNFDLASSTIIVQGLVGTTYWLIIEGTGTVSGNGFDATSGAWSFTSSKKDNTSTTGFSFQATSSVPDGGTTALLVGLGLVGMSVIARRRK
ncbi:MAG: 2-deoxy-D-gluconate-3-dehydrogenase [Verrucomicrobia bacterium]|nr:2-deoxy-D-gluconate-3-dehydrogenase [Verrucomicrobiota bacterium]